MNRLTAARRSHSGRLFDLTETNPTRAAIPYPQDELAEVMGRAARAPYGPDARGLLSARESIAGLLHCDSEDLVLTASTSEAYAFLLKLLTDPGDAIVAARPSYPLLDHLASLEQVEIHSFPLEHHGRWEIAKERLSAAVTARTRALLVVNPNNPTGSFVTREEQNLIAAAGLPVIADEVFLDYPIESAGATFSNDEVLTFTLGGLSKYAGLPHFKLAWIRVSGPGKHEALEALELIADDYLSVSTPVQEALPELLRLSSATRAAIHSRVRENLAAIRTALSPVRAVEALPVEGGWSAVLRVPRIHSDEDVALALLDRGVLVQPGYFYDFDDDGYLVISLLTHPDILRSGAGIIAAAAAEWWE